MLIVLDAENSLVKSQPSLVHRFFFSLEEALSFFLRSNNIYSSFSYVISLAFYSNNKKPCKFILHYIDSMKEVRMVSEAYWIYFLCKYYVEFSKFSIPIIFIM